MTSPALRLALDSIRAIAFRWYGFDGEITEFDSYYGQNFLVAGPDGPAYVLKVARPGETVDMVEMQHRAAEHLAAEGIGAEVPVAVPNREGQSVTATGGHMIHVLKYVPGVSWSELGTAGPERLYRLGQFVGRLGLAFRGFSHGAVDRVSDWDLRRVPTLRRRLSRMDDAESSALIERVIGRFEAHVAPPFSELRVAVIHGDVNNDNVLVAGDGRIVGLIDFELVGRSPWVAEPAIAAAYAMLGQPDPLAAAGHVLSGCHAVHPFLQEEMEIVVDLAVARLATSVTMTAYNATIDPGNPHLSLNAPAAWAVLERLDGADLRQVEIT